jgi:hypothetical protein
VRDYDEHVPDAWRDDPLAVHLRSKPFLGTFWANVSAASLFLLPATTAISYWIGGCELGGSSITRTSSRTGGGVGRVDEARIGFAQSDLADDAWRVKIRCAFPKNADLQAGPDSWHPHR